MDTKILYGNEYAKEIENNLKIKYDQLKQKLNYEPVFATIIVGEDPASVTYVRMKCNACERIGLSSTIIRLPENCSTQEVIDEINRLNYDTNVCGILIQHPLPKQIDEQKCFDSIFLSKDVDGVNSANFGKLCNKQKAFISATPKGIITLMEHYNIEIEGKHAVVVGRSAILGKPIAMQLLNKNATVTICHSKTTNLPEIIKTADIVVGALGKPKYIKADWIKQGAVLIDAGYNEGNVGDIDSENAVGIASAYTPVPKGVGPMTIVMLLVQCVESIENSINK